VIVPQQGTSDPSRPVLAVSMGDPLGIGPEVVAKAINQWGGRQSVRLHVYGQPEPLRAAAARAAIPLPPFQVTTPGRIDPAAEIVVVADPAWPVLSRTTPSDDRAAGEISYQSVLAAISACKLPADAAGAAMAICTAPISKKAWFLAGHGRYPGHTELLDEHFRDASTPEEDRAVMFFLGPRLKLVLVTVHVPLARVPVLLTREAIVHATRLGVVACQRLGTSRPRVAVCGLNPHAGEQGLLGTEDETVIVPAVEDLRSRGIDARGPLSADSVFLDAVKPAARGGGKFDLFVAMYHDQGLIPVKLLDRDESVNVTLGLAAAGREIVRTSPAHGTAFDIAGRNSADPSSMIAAMDAAVRLVGVTPQTHLS
jgi:4-hydroxythreonine-4-phosphate dehydrogenase